MLSIVLSVYNGAEFLEQQLDSLRLQTKPADEVIIADDESTDGSFQLIHDYISLHGLTNWSLRKNGSNMGWRASFRRLMFEASGDIVFPCDQDDIWMPNKLEVMSHVMEGRSDIDVLASSVKIVYEEGAQRTSASDAISDNSLEPYRPVFDQRFMFPNRPGCAMAIRRSFIQEIKPYWTDFYAHDATQWRYSSLKGTLYCIDLPLVEFRRHMSNASRTELPNLAADAEQLGFDASFVNGMLKSPFFASAPAYKKNAVRTYAQWLCDRGALLLGTPAQGLRALPRLIEHLDCNPPHLPLVHAAFDVWMRLVERPLLSV